MRAGASVTRVERNLEKRRIKSKARRGSGIAWWEAEIKGDIRCQTDGAVSPGSVWGPTWTGRATYVDMVITGRAV